MIDTSRYGSHSTRWNTAAFGRLHGALRHGGATQRVDVLEGSRLARALQPATSNSAQDRRLKAHTSISTEEPSRGDPVSTLLFNSLLQYIMKPPLTGKWKRHNRGVKLAEHDPDANLSNLRFADDILLISGSLKRTIFLLDDLATATTAHGL